MKKAAAAGSDSDFRLRKHRRDEACAGVGGARQTPPRNYERTTRRHHRHWLHLPLGQRFEHHMGRPESGPQRDREDHPARSRALRLQDRRRGEKLRTRTGISTSPRTRGARTATCSSPWPASKMAMEDSGLDVSTIDPRRFGVMVGSGIGGLATLEREHGTYMTKGPKRVSPFTIPMMISNIASGIISMEFGLKGRTWSSSPPAPPPTTTSAKPGASSSSAMPTASSAAAPRPPSCRWASAASPT